MEAFTHREIFTQTRFHTEKLLHKEVFTQRNFYARKLLHTKAFTQRGLGTAFTRSNKLKLAAVL